MSLQSDSALTDSTQEKQELAGISVETEVDRLRVENGANQVTFSCEEPWGKRHTQKHHNGVALTFDSSHIGAIFSKKRVKAPQ